MIGAAGQVALLRFPKVDLAVGKLRPVLVLARVPGRHDDGLVCMLSSQMHQAIEGFDEAILLTDNDFEDSGLKVATVARLGRLAVVESSALEGVLGALSPAQVSQIRSRLANWLASN
jgi:mRNA interferase MazF